MNKKKFWTKFSLISLALVMVSTAIVGISYAKYLETQSKTNNVGTVAKFGIEMAWADTALFAATYATEDVTYSATNATAVELVSDGATLAPGTKGETSIVFSGTPEVLVQLKLTLGAVFTGWTVDGEVAYEPIVFTIKEDLDTDKYWDTTTDDWTDTLTTITSADFKTLGDVVLGLVNPGAAMTERTFVIGWEWPFETLNNDVNDTFLGQKDVAPTLTLNLSATATQIN